MNSVSQKIFTNEFLWIQRKGVLESRDYIHLFLVRSTRTSKSVTDVTIVLSSVNAMEPKTLHSSDWHSHKK